MLGAVDEMQEAAVTNLAVQYIMSVRTCKSKLLDPFNGFSGIIEEVNAEKKKLKVMVKSFWS